MINELLAKLNKMEDINNCGGEIIIKKPLKMSAMSLAYDKKTRIALWWYLPVSGKLEYSEKATDDFDFNGCISHGWLRGRVFLYKDEGYVLMRLDQNIKIPGSVAADIVEKISQLSIVEIVGVVSERRPKI